MDIKSLLFSSIFIALFIIFLVPFATSQEVDDEHEFTYDVNSPNGPLHWGKIHPEWSICNQGDLQSPIDLTHNRVQVTSQLGRLNRDYKSANSTLINRGHDMMLRWIGGAGHIHINETEYQLNQLHWHTPSEHTINGRRFNLELHLVHQSTDGKIAVIGIMYKIGRPDSLLSMMEPYFKASASTKGVETSVGILDPRQIKIGSRKYYRYIGSLTTPPCTQNVIWTIVKKVRTASREQLHTIREAVHDDAEVNARPVQPLNNRWLKLYRPNDPSQPYRTRTILTPPGNFDPRYLPENYGHMPYVIPQYYGEHCNTLMVPSPSGGLFLVPVNEDQLPFLNHQIFERSRSLFLDGSNGTNKRLSSSSLMDERNRAVSAMGYDPAVVYNNSHLIHSGQSVQAVPIPWLDQHGATGAFSWNRVPYLQGCMNGCGMEAANMGLHGYQVTSISRNSTPFMHLPPIRPHNGPHIVYHPPPLPPPPSPPPPMPRVQAQNMDIHLQLASTSHTHSTSISSNPFRDGVEPGPRFVGSIPQPGFRLYEAHLQELMIDSTPRHRFPHLRGFVSEDGLVALGEQIDSVDSGLSDSFISDHLKTKVFALCRPSHAEYLMLADEEPNVCVICQMEFEDQEKIGMLDCWHEYHAECIKKWLIVKNNCPICKSTALA